MNQRLTLLAALLGLSTFAAAAKQPVCETQEVSQHKSVICLHDSGLFQHWIFSLHVDGQLIFNLVDDFAENVTLTHTIPPGLTMELPLSRGKKGDITLEGGCAPESDGEIEIARLCNFSWGGVKIIEQVRFVHADR